MKHWRMKMYAWRLGLLALWICSGSGVSLGAAFPPKMAGRAYDGPAVPTVYRKYVKRNYPQRKDLSVRDPRINPLLRFFSQKVLPPHVKKLRAAILRLAFGDHAAHVKIEQVLDTAVGKEWGEKTCRETLTKRQRGILQRSVGNLAVLFAGELGKVAKTGEITGEIPKTLVTATNHALDVAKMFQPSEGEAVFDKKTASKIVRSLTKGARGYQKVHGRTPRIITEENQTVEPLLALLQKMQALSASDAKETANQLKAYHKAAYGTK